jgi:hypothetical protein
MHPDMLLQVCETNNFDRDARDKLYRSRKIPEKQVHLFPLSGS